MKIKKLLFFGFGLLYSSTLVATPLVIAEATTEVPPPPEEEEEEAPASYSQTFIITAYYSPWPGQNHYVTGSYEGDIRLNGNGTNGADGTPVFPGMIAAPKTYSFGTKMYIPGIGMTAVHDRGGAIQPAGQRGNSYDRLDVWMGGGDEGLRKALGWGKRTVEVLVYGIQPELEEAVYFDSYSTVENLATQLFLNPLEFPNDLYFGTSSDSVKKMQGYLHDWGYLDMEPDGFYGESTANALFQFQLDFGIVSDSEELGAGHFGIKTRQNFDKLIKNKDTAAQTLQEKQGANLLEKYSDLYEEKKLFSNSLGLGDSGESVRQLQEELVRLGFLRIEPSGYFGETTEHALFKYQQSIGLVSDQSNSGAGYLGPQTRTALNKIIENRYESKSKMAYQREEIANGKKTLPFLNDTVAALKEEDSIQ